MTGETATVVQGTSQDQAGRNPQPNSVQASGDKGGSTSPRTYSEEEYTKGISDAVTKVGREHKVELRALTTERDTFKGQADQFSKQRQSLTVQINELTQQMVELTKDHPEGINWVKKRQEMQTKLDQLTDKESQLEQREQTATKMMGEAIEVKLEIAAFTVAKDYENGDAVKLKSLAARMKLTSEDDVRELADTIWPKKVSQNAPFNPDSNISSGGASQTLEALMKKDIRTMNQTDLLAHQKALERALRT